MIAISAGRLHTCALTTNRRVKCWGVLQLANGPSQVQNSPLDLPGLPEAVMAVSAGGIHTCLLTTTGGVYCWGSNSAGQLGNGTQEGTPTPVAVSGLTAGVTALSAGGSHTCAVTSTGGVKCWGLNASGQLGDGTYVTKNQPVDVQGLDKDMIAVSTGWGHTCALTSSGSVYCWGERYGKQAGNDEAQRHNTPVLVSGFAAPSVPVKVIPAPPSPAAASNVGAVTSSAKSAMAPSVTPIHRPTSPG